MSVEFYITKEIALVNLVNGFIDTGYDQIFTKTNLPVKFDSQKSDLDSIILASSSKYLNIFILKFVKKKLQLQLLNLCNICNICISHSKRFLVYFKK